ncbi:hypothetical protein CH366_13475 [Leptospira harrisiae]|uniref:Uncharacterized protein n=1 Tax=Leptospira harrisiae TaxID=2023189 RepID=A0A2N0AFJ3_9LEPT|nr:hypothetical protein CH364_17425 [Leptospira harrisiae]PKA07412.1 hypothetical protein CH366_13475 [Leptospira harrisiae]
MISPEKERIVAETEISLRFQNPRDKLYKNPDCFARNLSIKFGVGMVEITNCLTIKPLIKDTVN